MRKLHFRLVLLLLLSTPVIAAPVVNLYVHPAGGTGAGYTGEIFELADEFSVPAGQTWRITGVVNDGYAVPGPNYTVSFYQNSGGIPGAQVCTKPNSVPVGTFIESIGQIGSPEYRMPSVCVLGSGDYYFGFKASNSSASMQVNSTPTIVGQEIRIRDNGVNFCGSNFIPVSTCFGSAQDMRFTIKGCTGTSCEYALDASAACDGANLVVNIADGDATFGIAGTGPGLPQANVGIGKQTFIGPAIWDDVAVTELAGDGQVENLGDFNCGVRSATVVESNGGTIVDEQFPTQTDSYTIALQSLPNPGEIVTITPLSDTANGVTTDPAFLDFTNVDWNVPQTVTVSVVDDALEEPGGHDIISNVVTTTAGGVFDDATAPEVYVFILDNDGDAIFVNGFDY